MSAKPSVRERFSLEFVTANAEVNAMKELLGAASALPSLDLFDESEEAAAPAPEAPCAAVVNSIVDEIEQFNNGNSSEEATESESFEPSMMADADPVAELRMLFGSVNR